MYHSTSSDSENGMSGYFKFAHTNVKHPSTSTPSGNLSTGKRTQIPIVADYTDDEDEFSHIRQLDEESHIGPHNTSTLSSPRSDLRTAGESFIEWTQNKLRKNNQTKFGDVNVPSRRQARNEKKQNRVSKGEEQEVRVVENNISEPQLDIGTSLRDNANCDAEADVPPTYVDLATNPQLMCCSIQCFSVRVGNYRTENVKVDVRANDVTMRIKRADTGDETILELAALSITRCTAYLGQDYPGLLIIYTTEASGRSVRDTLGMEHPDGKYFFDPEGVDETKKRIIVAWEPVEEEQAVTIRDVFKENCRLQKESQILYEFDWRYVHIIFNIALSVNERLSYQPHGLPELRPIIKAKQDSLKKTSTKAHNNELEGPRDLISLYLH